MQSKKRVRGVRGRRTGRRRADAGAEGQHADAGAEERRADAGAEVLKGESGMTTLESETGIAAVLKGESGMTTLESAIIVPLMIFMLCISTYIALILFEQAQLQASSDYAARRASAGWRNGPAITGGAETKSATGDASAGDAETNSATGSASGCDDLYRRLFDTVKTENLINTNGIAIARHRELSLPGYTTATSEAGYRHVLNVKTVTVNLYGDTTMPDENATAVFGYSNKFAGKYGAASIAPDFAENIRCLDFALELNRPHKSADLMNAGGADGFSEALGRIRGYVGRYINAAR